MPTDKTEILTSHERAYRVTPQLPFCRSYWKPATSDERFITQAATIVWQYDRVAWLYERDEVVLGLDEQPHLQVSDRQIAPRPKIPTV